MNGYLKNIFHQDNIFKLALGISLLVHSFLLLNFGFSFPDIKNPKLVYIPKKNTKPKPAYLPSKNAPSFKDKNDLPEYVPDNVEIGMGKTRLSQSMPPEKKVSKLKPISTVVPDKMDKLTKDISDDAFKNMINLENVPPDPSIRAYYLNYYQSIRLKIRRIAYRKYKQSMPPGDVFLSFALERDGTLISAFVDRGRSSADYDLCQLALDSLREASPFEPFPKELIQDELSFNVVVSFRRK